MNVPMIIVHMTRDIGKGENTQRLEEPVRNKARRANNARERIVLMKPKDSALPVPLE